MGPDDWKGTLTEEQIALLRAHSDKWVQQGMKTDPLTHNEWQTVFHAARACYKHTGVDEPISLYGLKSPWAAAIAGPTAAAICDLLEARGLKYTITPRPELDTYGIPTIPHAVRTIVRDVFGLPGGVPKDTDDRWVNDKLGVDQAGELVTEILAELDGDLPKKFRGAPKDTELRVALSFVRDNWSKFISGHHWPYWRAYITAFTDVIGVTDEPVVTRVRDYADLGLAGNSWLFSAFGVTCDRPELLSVETVAGNDGETVFRLHAENGPATRWRDGFGFYLWHGTRVPSSLIEGDGWDFRQIMSESNLEVRRCAIERIGWDRFIELGNLKPVGASVPDPGNPGQTLTLYTAPMDLFEEPVRILLCTNGTLERGRTERRRFGLTVPASCKTPLEAAAWGYDDPDHPVRVDQEVYAELARRR